MAKLQLLLLSCVALAAGPAFGDVKTTVTVRYAGAQAPTAMTLSDQAKDYDLVLASGAYSAAYPHADSGAYVRNAVARARYGDANSAPLPLRLWPTLSEASATIYKIDVTSCYVNALAGADEEQGNVDDALAAYYRAAALYKLSGAQACGPRMKRKVAKAWFDRSYELVRLRPYFQLSEPAAKAYDALAPGVVRHYRIEAKSIEFRIAYEAMKDAIKASDKAQATRLLALMSTAIQASPDDKAAAARQGITEARLREDAVAIGAISPEARNLQALQIEQRALGEVGDVVKRLSDVF